MASISLQPPSLMDDPARGSLVLRGQRVRALLWLTLIFWGSNLLLLTLGTALAAKANLAQLTGMRVLTTLIGLGLCYLIHLILGHPRLSTMRKRLIALAIIAPIAAEAFAWASFFAEASVDPALWNVRITGSSVVRTISFWTWYFLAWAGLYLALSYSFDVREEQQRSAEIKEQAHIARLRALHSQINPHFLFNSLNSVSALILDRKVELADQMVAKLARFLRMGLAADPTTKIRLTAEIELQRAYLEIEQLRYHDLDVEISVPDELQDALVPALILQPIVENAVKYGVAGASPPSTIAIEASSDGLSLILRVRDSGKGSSKTGHGSGIGLANVRQRLQLLYGSRSSDLAIGELPDGSFEAVVTLPLEHA